MRFLIASVLLILAIAPPIGSAHAATTDPGTASTATLAQEQIDDNDDTRVEVQVVVLAIVIGTVFVFGSVLYLLRKRLGLVPPSPEQGADGHH